MSETFNPAPRDGSLAEPWSDRGVLVCGYLVGALVPVVGWVTAVYIAVSERRGKIRRHAIGIAALALATAGIYLAILLSASGPRPDSAVASDLGSLMSSHGLPYVSISCAHQSGDQYSCIVTGATGQGTDVVVTDDGHNIIEQGLGSG